MIEVHNLTKVYKPKKGEPVKALDGVDLKIENKGMVFILGKSGSGKSTLLNMLGGLDKYDEGEIIIKGKSSKNFTQSEFDSYRNTYLGFIFQEYNILNEFSVGANIALAMELQGKKATNEALNELLKTVDLEGYASRKPNELSGGQKQRIAIARALIKDPEIIMADEPTGALDSKTGKQVFETLKKLSKDKLVIIVSHDREFAEYYGDRVIELADGKIISDISKYKDDTEKENENVSVIDNKILHIKKGYRLTARDLDLINKYIEDNQSDTIISCDEKANIDFKKLARIDDEGNRDSFKNTKNEDIKTEEYNKDSFKLIKSKLPLKSAFKIGVSSLSAKPIKLFFTILLSSIAFCLFGLADTMSAYSKANTTYRSLIDNNIEYVSFSKIQQQEYNGYINNNNTKQDDEDIAMLNAKFPSSKFIPVYKEGSYYSGNLNINNVYDNSKLNGKNSSFYKNIISGFAELDSIEDLNAFDYNLVGSFPTTTKEVIISEYIFEHFKIGGYQDPTTSIDEEVTIEKETDLIGKTIKILDSNYTISGILSNCNIDKTRYKQFLPDYQENSEEGIDSYLLLSELTTLTNSGPYSICFTKKGFIKDNLNDTNIDVYSPSNSSGGIYFFFESEDQNKNKYSICDSFKVYDPMANSQDIVMLNGKTGISNVNEIIIPLSALNSILSNYNNNEEYENQIRLPNDFDEKYFHLVAEGAYNLAIEKLNKDPHSLDEYKLANNIMEKDNEVVASMFSQYYQDNMFPFNNSKVFVPYFNKKPSDFYLEEFKQDLASAIQLIPTKVLDCISFNLNDYNKNDNEPTKIKLNIVGIELSNAELKSFDQAIFVSENFITIYNLQNAKYKPYSFIITNTPSNDVLKEMVNFSYQVLDNSAVYPIQNSITAVLSQINSIIEMLSKVFLYVGIVFAVFASFLMLNFISTSISYKKREIGILRAVGARSNDVFSIFFSESFMIAILNATISIILTLVVTFVINTLLKNNFAIQLTILILGIRQIGLLLLISIFVAFIASLFPVSKIAHKKPIDAIHNK